MWWKNVKQNDSPIFLKDSKKNILNKLINVNGYYGHAYKNTCRKNEFSNIYGKSHSKIQT